MNGVLIRGVVVWFGLLAVAIVNGAAREGFLTPRWGEHTAHALSTITLSVSIVLVAWFSIRWLDPRSSRDAWAIGGLWVALTLAFEFLAGHYLFGHPWSRLLADYNVLAGRIWPLVLITTALAPRVSARARL
jgi:hypothetical protein